MKKVVIQRYLSSNDRIVQEYLQSINESLYFIDCKCRNKGSLIPVHYQIFQKYGVLKSGKKVQVKQPRLNSNFFLDEKLNKIIFENGVVLYELNKCLAVLSNNNIVIDKFFFRMCVEDFIEHTYKSHFLHTEQDKIAFYELCDSYYDSNCQKFNDIAAKRSFINHRLSIKKNKRYTSLKVKNKKHKNMNNYNEQLINDLYNKYRSREIRSVKQAAEMYTQQTGEKIIEKTMYNRFNKIAAVRGEQLKVKRLEIIKKNVTKLTEEELNTMLRCRKKGFTYKECLEYLHKTGVIISKSCLYKQLKAAEDAKKSEVSFTPVFNTKKQAALM